MMRPSSRSPDILSLILLPTHITSTNWLFVEADPLRLGVRRIPFHRLPKTHHQVSRGCEFGSCYSFCVFEVTPPRKTSVLLISPARNTDASNTPSHFADPPQRSDSPSSFPCFYDYNSGACCLAISSISGGRTLIILSYTFWRCRKSFQDIHFIAQSSIEPKAHFMSLCIPMSASADLIPMFKYLSGAKFAFFRILPVKSCSASFMISV